jgi:hypothetical protein
MTPGVHASVLGLTEAINTEATAALRVALKERDYLRVTSALPVTEIIQSLAKRHIELNDRVQLYPVCLQKPPLYADGFCLNTLEPAQAGSDVTADHILTASANLSSSLTLSSSSWQAVPGLAFTVSTDGTSDVYNFNGFVSISFGTADNTTISLGIFVDGSGAGATEANYPVVVYMPSGTNSVTLPYFASLTGLSAGAHTLALYALYSGGTANPELQGGRLVVQRIF